MTRVTSRLLTLLLTFAMVFTSLGWLGSFEANAAEGDTYLYVKVVDASSHAEIADATVTLTDAENENDVRSLDWVASDKVYEYDSEPDAEELFTKDMDPDAYYVLEATADGYVGSETIPVVFGGTTSVYIHTVDGAGYSQSSPFVIELTKENAEVPNFFEMNQKSDKTEWKSWGTEELGDDDYIVDVRAAADYAKAHIPGAVSVPTDGNEIAANSDAAKGLDAALAAAGTGRVVLICYSGNKYAARAMDYLYHAHSGLTKEKVTFLIGGDNGYDAANKVPDFVTMNQQSDKTEWKSWGVDALADGDYIIDLRDPSSPNYNGSTFSGAISVPVANAPVVEGSSTADLLDAAYEVADGNRIVLICYSGNMIAARGMNYFYNRFGNVGKDAVTFLNGGASTIDGTKTIPRTLGAEKSRTMTTTIDMSKYEKGKVVKVWVPVPQTEDYQVISNEKFEAKTAKVAKFTTESVNGNKMLYLEWAADAEPAARKATLSFDAKRNEAGHTNLVGYKGAADEYPDSVKEYITKESEFVKVNAEVVQKYAEIAIEGADDDTLSKAKAIYEWETANLERIDNGETLTNAGGETREFKVEGCGYGDTVKILTDYDEFGRAGGHCTDLNSTFVALCRANGIPAREMFGIRMNDDATGGQHCWAEFYLPGTGWVFADPGDALKAIKSKKGMTVEEVAAAKDSETFAQKKAYFWGTVDENRIVLSRGRDITFNPPQAWGTCNTFGYPAAEVGGQRMPADFTDAKNFVYSIACTEVKAPEPTPTPASKPAITDGQTAVVNGSTVKVTSASAKTAEYVKAPNKKSVTVPATVAVNGQTLAVTSIGPKAFTGKKIKTVTVGANVSKIAANAFKGSKATKMIVKSKALTKASVKGSLKGSKIKTVQVKVGKKKENKKFVKKYKKFFTKKNAGKKAKVK